MLTMAEIQKFADQIAREFKPERIILFGSYAYGTPHDGSDIDLLVVMPLEGSPLDKAIEILRKLRPTFGIDLLVRSPEELKQRLEWNDFFLREVVEKGKLLYDAAYAGVGS
jgi:uncharacterized protein